jgi:hypothetical protein
MKKTEFTQKISFLFLSLILGFDSGVAVAQDIDDLKPIAPLALPDLSSIKDRLSLTERSAIRAYTSGKYEMINGVLRGTMAPTLEISNLISRVSSGLVKLPPYQGQVYRYASLRWSLIKTRYWPGAVVVEPFFVSAAETRDGTKIDLFLKSGLSDPEKRHVYFVIQSKSGKNIQPYSVYPFEKEILFNRGTSFQVVQVKPANGYLLVRMNEL